MMSEMEITLEERIEFLEKEAKKCYAVIEDQQNLIRDLITFAEKQQNIDGKILEMLNEHEKMFEVVQNILEKRDT